MILRSDSTHAFDRHTHHLIGTPLATSCDWQAALFSRMWEAVKLTALQRGVERWMPGWSGDRVERPNRQMHRHS